MGIYFGVGDYFGKYGININFNSVFHSRITAIFTGYIPTALRRQTRNSSNSNNNSTCRAPPPRCSSPSNKSISPATTRATTTINPRSMTPIIIAPSTTTTKTTTITTTISTRTRPIRIIKPSSPLVSTFKWPCPVSVAWPVSRPDRRRRRRRHCLRRRLRITTAGLPRHRACPAPSSSLAMLPRPRPRPLLTSIIGRNGISLPCSSSSNSIATSHHPPPAPPPRTPGIITAMITRCTAGIKSTFASLAASPMPARPRWRHICARIRARNRTGEENEDWGGGYFLMKDKNKRQKNNKKITKNHNRLICRNKRPPKTVISQGRGGVHKTDSFWWVLEIFLLLIIKRPGRLSHCFSLMDFLKCVIHC